MHLYAKLAASAALLLGVCQSSHALCFVTSTYAASTTPVAGGFQFDLSAAGEYTSCSFARSGSLSSFDIPYFADAGISAVTAPTGWTAVIEQNNDLLKLGHGAGVIEFTANDPANYAAPFPAAVLTGFGFTAKYDGVAVKNVGTGTFVDGDGAVFTQALTGNPLLIPASPDALAAYGLTPAVPEPGEAAMLLAGLLIIGTALRKRRG